MRMNVVRIILIFLGTLSLGLGLLGIVVPGLPATPFFLLTAGLWLRSSERLHRKLLANKVVGRYIHDFYTRKGMTPRTKIYSIALMWTMISISCGFFISSLPVILIVVATGVTGTVVMGFIIPTVRDPIKEDAPGAQRMTSPESNQAESA